MDIYEAYIEAEKSSGLKVGDRVVVTRKAERHELGWRNSWPSGMNRYIGITMTVEDISTTGNGIRMDKYPYIRFPFFVLELIEER